MNKKPSVSVIIPTYNRKHCLGRALDSVFSQAYRDYEVIVVDDASTDGTLEFIAKSYPNIRLIKLPCNRNAAGARNEGIRNARGEFIAFLDSDDEWSSDFLENSIKALQNNISAVFSVCDCIIQDKKWESSPSRDYIDPIHEQLMRTLIITMSTVVARKEALMKAGLLNEKLTMPHDRELYLRLLFLGNLVYLPHALVTKFDQPDSLSNNYKRWAKEAFLLLDIFFSDERSKPYIRFSHQAKSRWAFRIFGIALEQRDFKFAAKMLLKSFLHSFKTAAYQTMSSFKKHPPFLPTPGEIVLFLTSTCNLSCAHCFVTRGSSELSIENIEKITNSLGRETGLALTGGEPFLRDDLSQIISTLLGNSHVRNMHLCSNGSMPEKIESVLGHVLSKNKKPLSLQLSLDGLAGTHDAIRASTGNFDKALETCERAKRLRSIYPNFSFVAHITIMGVNVDEVEKLVDYLEYRKIPSKLALFRHDAFSVFGLPPDISNPETERRRALEFDTQKVAEMVKRISKKYPKYFNSIQRRKMEIMLNTMRSKKRQVRCYAGYEDAVIYSNADIAVCEHVRPFGNMARWNWDVIKAWNSSEANEQRSKLKSCACTHGCNTVTSIGMKPRIKARITDVALRTLQIRGSKVLPLSR